MKVELVERLRLMVESVIESVIELETDDSFEGIETVEK